MVIKNYGITGWIAHEMKQSCVATTLPESYHTNAPKEALNLALRSGLIFIDTGSEATHRIYGCLYGFEKNLDNKPDYANPIVPSKVSNAIAIQKIFSSIFIFLFGLGVRNLLRMK